MAYNFIDKENEITKLLPAYIFNYSDDNKKGLFLFIKYLTNYIETANEALDTICSELNVNSDYTFILDILARKLGVEIPTTITSVKDKQTVLKGKIMTLSSTGCAQAIIDTIYGLYPEWEKYNIKGTPIELDDTLEKLFYNTNETPTLGGLGWDNADETTNVFGTVTKVLNVLVSTTGPVVQLVRKEYDNLIGYSVIVHYTTESDDVNVISYKDENTCDIETHITPVSSEIDEVKSFIANQKTFYSKPKYNTYDYDAEDMYYNSYRPIKYTTNWENYTWQNLPNNISRSDIWQDNDGNIYATREIFQYKLNKQTLTWEAIQFTGLQSFYRNGIWTDGKTMYYSGSIWNSDKSEWENVNYELTDNYTWIPKTWKGLEDTLIKDGGGLRGGDIWTDGEKIYFSTQLILSGGTTKYYNYVLNSDTSTWSTQTWEGINNIQTGKLFHYKDQVLYCVLFDSNKQNFTTEYYTLNIGTNRWTKHNWPDGIYINPLDIWSDGNDYYYSSQDPFIDNLINNYKLNQTSFTWEPITWTGLEDIDIPTGRLIWHFDNNVFYGFTKRLAIVNSDKVITDGKKLDNNYQIVFSTQSKSYGDFIPKTFFADDNIQQSPLPSNTINGIDVWRNIKNNKLYYNDPTNSRYYYKQTSAWLDKTWNTPNNVKLLYGRDIYTIDDNTYYTNSENDTATPISLQLTSDNTWINKSWGNSEISNGREVWKTKDNVYYYGKYKFTYSDDFNNKLWKGLNSFTGKYIWKYDDNNIYYSENSVQYRLERKRYNWTSVTWTGYNKIIGNYIWKTKNNIYYSHENNQYRLDSNPPRWTAITWTGLTNFDGDHIWSDGENIYYTGYTTSGGDIITQNYKLDEQSLNWERIGWTGDGEYVRDGRYIWSAGENIYYSEGGVQLQFNKSISKWMIKSWVGYNKILGNYIWKKGSDIYYSNGTEQYKLLADNTEWVKADWTCLTNFNGDNIWTDEENIYYSAENVQYSLEYFRKPKFIVWHNIPDTFDPINIWHIGDTTYYSNGTIHKIINEDTTSFDNFTEWKGLSNFDGKDIWKDTDGNIFYKDTYILDTKTKTWLPKYWNLNDNKKSSDVIKSEYIWNDLTSTYINNDYILNSYIDTCTQNCKFDNKQLSIESKLTREYATYPINPVRLQAPSYALDMVKSPVELSGWHSPYGIESPVTVVNNVTDNISKRFEIVSEKYQNEWGRYISKDGKFNPIIKNAVSVIDEGSLLQGSKNMHYKVIIDGPELTEQEKTIITKYLIPKFLGVGYEVEFKQ